MKTRRLAFAICVLLPCLCRAQQGPPSVPLGSESTITDASVEVDVYAADGAALNGSTYVSLIKNDGKVFATTIAVGGKAHFAKVPKTELMAQVVASGYDTASKKFEVLDRDEVKVRIDLRPMTDREAASTDRGIAALNPKAQKSMGKALEEMRANKLANAQADLTAAQRYAPDSADVEYFLGVCASRMNDAVAAKTHWNRALSLNASHLSTLLALGQSLLRERDTKQANVYLTRAVSVEPSSWRAHMLVAQADLLDRKNEEAVREAERAVELGHDAADPVQLVLAHALFETGEKQRANQILQDYIKAHPKDENAARLFERLNEIQTTNKSRGGNAPKAGLPAVGASEMDTEAAEPLPANWLPPDIDDKVPPVESGTACATNDVIEKAGEQLVNLIHDVDKFTATETLIHESINKFGVAALPEKRRFDYLVSIQNSRSGQLSVSEYRNGSGSTEFPDGIMTSGLPALVLVFHPYYATSYDMVCEGLARTSRGLAWQVHFRQLPNKTNGIKSYQLGMNGPNYPVRLKGRAWFSAENYEILRMESTLIAPIPEIRLLADHTVIEYGPVNFRQTNTRLWLPVSAEVYVAWLGKRIHRRHEFSNYLLFGVDDQQQIHAPKAGAGSQSLRE